MTKEKDEMATVKLVGEDKMLTATISDEVITKDTSEVSGWQPQGFTMNTNTGKCFVARLYENKDDKAILTRVVHFGKDKGTIDKYKGTKKEPLKLGHANNMAYFDGRIFIVTGKSNRNIFSYTTDFSSEKKFTVEKGPKLAQKDFDKVSKFTFISYIGSEWFLLGVGSECLTAWFNGSKFIANTYFDLPKIENSTIFRPDTTKASAQGCFVDGWALYRPYSLHTVTDQVIKKNTIVSFVLTGKYPSYTGAVRMSDWKCDKKDLAFFEVEGISQYDGKFYISVATKTSDNGAIQNRIYKVTF